MERKWRRKLSGLLCKDKIYCFALFEGSAGALRERCGIISTPLSELPKGFPVAIPSPLPSSHPQPSSPLLVQDHEAPWLSRRKGVLRESYSVLPWKTRDILCWGLTTLAMGMAQWSDNSFLYLISLISKTVIWPRRNFLLLVFLSTNCCSGMPTWCTKPLQHHEGIYDNEMKATPEVASVKERYL